MKGILIIILKGSVLVILILALTLTLVFSPLFHEVLFADKAMSEQELINLFMKRCDEFIYVASLLYEKPEFWTATDSRRNYNWTLNSSDLHGVSYAQFYSDTEWERVNEFIKSTEALSVTYCRHLADDFSLPNLSFQYLSNDRKGNRRYYFDLIYIPTKLEHVDDKDEYIDILFKSLGWDAVYKLDENWFLRKW